MLVPAACVTPSTLVGPSAQPTSGRVSEWRWRVALVPRRAVGPLPERRSSCPPAAILAAPGALISAPVAWRLRRRRRGRCGVALRAGGATAEAVAVAPSVGAVDGQCFEILPVSDKGFGAVATRDIARGELVVAEKPLICYRDDASWQYAVQRQFDALPASAQEAVLRLEDVNMFGGQRTVPGIVGTNTVGCSSESFDGVVCETCSRFNHSCIPNCEQTWDETTSKECIFASTDIKAGEELCISYVQPFISAKERSSILEESYKFRCACPACSSGSAGSDGRRERLRQLAEDIGDGVDVIDAMAGVGTAKELLALFDEEGLHMQGFRAQACYHAFKSLLLAGRADEARKWGEDAAMHCELCRGKSHPETLLMAGYAQDPGSHPAAQQTAWEPGLAWLAGGLVVGGVAFALLSK
mmetsp:Transcript_60356/g.168642  ORF Transcript_60356/g.168642 Transcript_60356/m.168642 type:complete len:413 (+) Transcript_60356:58-1296(+)